MGLDKFANVLADWEGYPAPLGRQPAAVQRPHGHAHRGRDRGRRGGPRRSPARYAAYVVALWLAGIIVNLLTYPGFFDVALRDVGLLLGALALGQLARAYQRPQTGTTRPSPAA